MLSNSEKIEAALNEGRILVLGVQVLVGFAYQAIFQDGFDKLPLFSQHIKLISLGLLLLALALLIAPIAYHRLVTSSLLDQKFHDFITRCIEQALLPLAVALSLECYVVGAKIVNRPAGIACGLLAGLLASIFWYGIEFIVKGKPSSTAAQNHALPAEPTPLKDKIKFVLTEARVVLPGVQALLGFQFAAVLTGSFDKLPSTLQYVHLASLACITCSAILLMAPAAFHRIVEQGQDTNRLYSFASRMILAAMVWLALGIAGAIFIVVAKVLRSEYYASMAAGVTLSSFYGLWFGYTLYRKFVDTGLDRRNTSSSTP